MQRAVTPVEPTEPQMTKAQASPNKVSTSSAKTSPIKEIITTQKSGKKDENHQKIQTAGGPRKEDTMPHIEKPLGSISGPTEEKIDGSTPPEYRSITTPLTKGTAAVTFDSDKPLAQPIVVDKDIKTSESPPAKKDIGKKEEAAETVKKSTDKPEEVKPKQTLIGESNLLKSSLAETAPSVTQTPNQESGGFFSSSSPMPQLSTSKTAEAVTGKVLGFGSSFFSSASTLITSAVQESRTTPPNSRKMSAPAQISDKVSASKVLPKSSPPVSPKRMLTKETKPPTIQTLLTEKEQDKPLQAKVTTPAQTKADRGLSEAGRPDVAPAVGKSTCPLCKADLNVGSKDPANYRTCTECKTLVCSKCGFSPMPSVKEVIKFISPYLRA